MAGEGNLMFATGIPQIDRTDGSLAYSIQQLLGQVGYQINVDYVINSFAGQVCHLYSTILYPLEYCCVFPSPGPSEGEPPTQQVPTILDQLEPILDTFDQVPIEEDDLIKIVDIACNAIASIPITDLAAVAIPPELASAEPGAPENPTALIGMPDPYEQFDRVDVGYSDVLTRGGLPSTACSVDGARSPSSPNLTHLQMSLPVATSGETAARKADATRLRSQVERPISFWTSPKWIRLNLADVVIVNHVHGATKCRITNIEFGGDMVLRFDAVVCSHMAHWPYTFFATNAPWPVPTVAELEAGDLNWGHDGEGEVVFYSMSAGVPEGVTPSGDGGLFA